MKLEYELKKGDWHDLQHDLRILHAVENTNDKFRTSINEEIIRLRKKERDMKKEIKQRYGLTEFMLYKNKGIYEVRKCGVY
tara:strand:+ start:9253 stop:9495 length:243 start_codon:yes stop_codon:yes gene_type:complete